MIKKIISETDSYEKEKAKVLKSLDFGLPKNYSFFTGNKYIEIIKEVGKSREVIAFLFSIGNSITIYFHDKNEFHKLQELLKKSKTAFRIYLP